MAQVTPWQNKNKCKNKGVVKPNPPEPRGPGEQADSCARPRKQRAAHRGSRGLGEDAPDRKQPTGTCVLRNLEDLEDASVPSMDGDRKGKGRRRETPRGGERRRLLYKQARTNMEEVKGDLILSQRWGGGKVRSIES